MQQKDALDLLKLGENIFLTGPAGSGKTWLLNRYIRHLREHDVRVAITASTGIAATHLNGRTIHSWSGIGVHEELTSSHLDKLLRNKRIKNNYSKNRVLVLDEISMLHAHQLDMLDQIARAMLDAGKPFGGLQVILCGDFFQLPPVSTGSNQPLTRFAYEAQAWRSGNFRVCYLEEQHRQGNDPLLDVLNDIRGGTAGEQTKVPLRTRYKREPEADIEATRLYARNINVDAINQQALAGLNGKKESFSMQSRGPAKLLEGLIKSCLAPEQLTLKVGAQVMFVKNAPDGSYVNGTRALVTGFDKDEGWPLVKTFDGRRLVAEPEDWSYEEDGFIRASISQVPLRLAWAITIHKSQGMTLDAVEVDLSDAFEPGMGYVALSRVRSLKGLKLMGLNDMALQVNADILQRDKVFLAESLRAGEYLQGIDPGKKQEMQQQVLVQRFEGRHQAVSTENNRSSGSKMLSKNPREKKRPTHEITGEMLGEGLSVEIIARKRGLKAGTVIDHIEKLKGLNKLPNTDALRNLLKEEDINLLVEEFRRAGDGKLSPLHQKFEGKYSYEQLKIARLFAW